MTRPLIIIVTTLAILNVGILVYCTVEQQQIKAKVEELKADTHRVVYVPRSANLVPEVHTFTEFIPAENSDFELEPTVDLYDMIEEAIKATESSNSPEDMRTKHEAILKKIQPEYQRMKAEGEQLLGEIWDFDAENLRPKSIDERKKYLEQYKDDLENEADEDDTPELKQELLELFIKEMNKRGIQFE